MIYDVTISVDPTTEYFTGRQFSQNQLTDLGITNMKYLFGSTTDGQQLHTWRIFTTDEQMSTVLALKFLNVSTEQQDILADNLRQLEEEYQTQKASLLAKLAGENL